MSSLWREWSLNRPASGEQPLAEFRTLLRQSKV
jgi:hypothetical protein